MDKPTMKAGRLRSSLLSTIAVDTWEQTIDTQIFVGTSYSDIALVFSQK